MPVQEDLNQGWHKVVRHFSPSWFTVTMGTGIVSILLYELPYNGRGLYWLSVVTFCWNIFLFFLASLVSLLRHVFWPEMWTLMMRQSKPIVVSCCSTNGEGDRIPGEGCAYGKRQGLGTIIQMVVFICLPV